MLDMRRRHRRHTARPAGRLPISSRVRQWGVVCGHRARLHWCVAAGHAVRPRQPVARRRGRWAAPRLGSSRYRVSATSTRMATASRANLRRGDALIGNDERRVSPNPKSRVPRAL